MRCGCVCVLQVAADLFGERPPALRKWPRSLPRTCRRPWPLYTSAGISLCATPGGKLQLLVLSQRKNKERRNKDAEERVRESNSDCGPTFRGIFEKAPTLDPCGCRGTFSPFYWKFNKSVVTCLMAWSAGSLLLILFWS